METIIQLLKKFRIEQGLTQAALGKKLGLPQSHVSKIEKGEIDLRLSTLLEMARVLDTELLLVPRNLIMPVLAMVKGGDEGQKPRWTIDEEDNV